MFIFLCCSENGCLVCVNEFLIYMVCCALRCFPVRVLKFYLKANAKTMSIMKKGLEECSHENVYWKTSSGAQFVELRVVAAEKMMESCWNTVEVKLRTTKVLFCIVIGPLYASKVGYNCTKTLRRECLKRGSWTGRAITKAKFYGKTEQRMRKLP